MAATSPQNEPMRATVSRFPYLNEDRNESVDVSAIPCAVKGLQPADPSGSEEERR